MGSSSQFGDTVNSDVLMCQCITCQPCLTQTSWLVSDMDSRPELVNEICLTCLRSGHHSPGIKLKGRESFTVLPLRGGSVERQAWENQQNALAAQQVDEAVRAQQIAYWDINKCGSRFTENVLDEYVDRELRAELETLIGNIVSGNGHGINLVVTGGQGTGKSFIISAVARRLVVEGIIPPQHILFDSETKLLSPITSTGILPSERQAALEKITNPATVKMVCIDNVGAALYPDDAARMYVWAMLTDFAYSHDVPLLVAKMSDPDPELAARPPVKAVDARPGTENPFGDIVPAGGDSSFVNAANMVRNNSPRGLRQWVGGNAYDKLITNTVTHSITHVGGVNKRLDVADGRIPRNRHKPRNKK